MGFIASCTYTIWVLYRLWETLTFGTVPVIEKGTGLDKPVSSYLYVNDTIMYCTVTHCTVLFFSL